MHKLISTVSGDNLVFGRPYFGAVGIVFAVNCEGVHINFILEDEM